MERQRWRVAILGGSVHDELVLKSLLQLVAGKTAASWEFGDSMDADVLLCEPASALAAIAARRAAEEGRPLCVALARHGQPVPPLERAVHTPLRAHELVALLDTVSAASRAGHRDGTPARGEALAADTLFADVLHRLVSRPGGEPGAYHVVTHAGSIVVLLPERSFVCADAEESTLARLAAYRGRVAIERLSAGDAEVLRRNALRRPLEPLLWRCGLASEGSRWMSAGTPTARFKLRRWPDFGRVPSNPAHLALAAALGANPGDAEELAARTRQSAESVRTFLNACAICGLLDAAEPPAARPLPRVARRGWTHLLQHVRSALGLAAS
jgi:hypothetical protein